LAEFDFPPWHTKGRPIIYTAEHPAGALSEFLVHLDRQDIPDGFQLLTIEIDDEVETQQIEADQLPDGWTRDNRLTRPIGDKWLASGSSLLLRVPSVIIPDAYNVLINPTHSSATRMRIAKIAKVPLDERLV
jgi:RES domain-containing protein